MSITKLDIAMTHEQQFIELSTKSQNSLAEIAKLRAEIADGEAKLEELRSKRAEDKNA